MKETDRIVVVNLPVDLMMGYLPFVRAARDEPPPFPTRLLSAGFTAVELELVDEFTVDVRPNNGLLATPWAQIFRDPIHRFHPGDSVALSDMTATVLHTTGDGRPDEIRYRFTVPVDDPSLRWTQWTAKGFAPFTLPAKPGETVRLERLPLLWWL